MADSHSYEMCTFCPKLCRHVCPVGLVTGREAAHATAMMSAVHMWGAGLIPAETAARAAALCTGCGACTEHCRYHWPVADLLSEARGSLRPAPRVDRPGETEGDGDWVAVECGGTPWAHLLARRLAMPAARLVTRDHLGIALQDHLHLAEAHLRRLCAVIGPRQVVTSCESCARMLRAAGLEPHSLLDVADLHPEGPVVTCHHDGVDAFAGLEVVCVPGGCGAHGVLPAVHPDIAREMARAMAARVDDRVHLCPDTRCAGSLAEAGARVMDPVRYLELSLESER